MSQSREDNENQQRSERKKALTLQQMSALEEYSKRPAKDKRCVEILLCSVLFVVLATIIIRFFIKRF